MRWWVPADISHVSRGVWRVYVPGPDIFVDGTTERGVKDETEKVLIEAYGTRNFTILWRES
jgi:hypothetical protein